MSLPLIKNLTNCTISPDIDVLETGSNQIRVIADSGFIFDIEPSFTYQNYEGSIITIVSQKISDYEYLFDFFVRTNSSDYILNAVANVESQTSNKYGVLQIHKITPDILKSFNDLRYYAGSGSLSQIDLSQYVSSLKVIFYDVSTETTDNIIVSNIDTGIIAPRVLDDNIIIDLGNYNLTGLYQNNLDRKYSTISIELPFMGLQNIDSVYMNETINIKYLLNIITGDFNIIISIVRNEKLYLINSFSGNMSFDLPYTYPIESQLKIINDRVKQINFNTPPRIIIKENLKADNNIKIYDCYKIDKLKNETGYFKCSFIDVNNLSVNENIKSEIESLLLNGVYI